MSEVVFSRLPNLTTRSEIQQPTESLLQTCQVEPPPPLYEKIKTPDHVPGNEQSVERDSLRAAGQAPSPPLGK